MLLSEECKVTWCELATTLAAANDHMAGPRVARAETLLGLYGKANVVGEVSRTRLGVAVAEEAVVDVITDLLHWLSAHGCDPEASLDRAQTHFESEAQPIA